MAHVGKRSDKGVLIELCVYERIWCFIMAERVLMKGNEAIAEAAIRCGCRHFFGYPITPQTEISAYMSKKMPKIGGTFLQAESEIAAINMVLVQPRQVSER